MTKRKNKEPSLLRKIIDIHFEQARRRKVIRRLEQQSWDLDFLSLLLIKVGKQLDKGVSLIITNKDGITFELTYDKTKRALSDNLDTDNDIFMKLDDAVAVQDFIAKHGR